ncbi:cell wall-binding repeat protein, partial [Parvimonas sp. KA00067]
MKKKALLTVGLSFMIIFSANSVKAGEWKSNKVGSWYEEKDGSYPTSTWKEISNKWYYFDKSGFRLTNVWVGNYYLGKDGAMLVNTTTPDGYKVDE